MGTRRESLPLGGDVVLGERVNDLWTVEQARALCRCSKAVHHVVIIENLPERASAPMLTDDVLRDLLLFGRALEEEREQVREHAGDCILRLVRRRSRPGRFAERTLGGFDDTGAEERIVFWINRRAGALWVVGRAINPQIRATDEPRPEDVIFESYELEEALDRANDALEDDLRVLEADGQTLSVQPFTRKEVLPLLERWFFGR